MKLQTLLLTALLLSGCASFDGSDSSSINNNTRTDTNSDKSDYVPDYNHDTQKTKVYGSVLVSSIISIYDGDTFRANINAYPAVVGKNIPIRVLGIDTPEIRGKCQSEKDMAKEAKQFAVEQLTQASRIELTDVQRGKYFRLLAVVLVDGESLGELMINQNLAVQYDGGTKKDWCEP